MRYTELQIVLVQGIADRHSAASEDEADRDSSVGDVTAGPFEQCDCLELLTFKDHQLGPGIVPPLQMERMGLRVIVVAVRPHGEANGVNRVPGDGKVRYDATTRRDALARLQPADEAPLLVVVTEPFVGEGFDCPVLDTLFLAAPIAFKGRLVQYAGRILRPHRGKTIAEIHDYHDISTGVLASSLAKRPPGYTSLGFPNSRRAATR